MSNLTPNEQFMLELINRARLDPAAEAARQHISLNEGLKSGTISTSAKQALAGNALLYGTADNHSQWMLDHDLFQHNEGTTNDPIDPFDRMDIAGYDFLHAGENISWTGTTGTLDATKAIESQFNDLFIDSGISGRLHRLNILDPDFREAGVGQQTGNFTTNGHTYHASMVTQDFGSTGSDVFITGVVYTDDVKNDDFFTVGEQQASFGVSAHHGSESVSDSTGAGGGYEIIVAPSSGKWVVAFDTLTQVEITVGTQNVKLDFVNGNEVWTSGSVTSLSTTIVALHALGLSNTTLAGSSAAEHIFGNKGNNKVLGNGGADTLIGGAGHDTLTGGAGNDHFLYKSASESGTSSTTRDTVTDFDAAGNDVIDLSVLSGTYAYRGTGAFTGAHQVRVTSTTGGVLVHVSTDTDHTDEMTIFLSGAHLGDMSKGDFIL